MQQFRVAYILFIGTVTCSSKLRYGINFNANSYDEVVQRSPDAPSTAAPLCIDASRQLLRNLYLDYFRSEGPCTTAEGRLVHTFSSSRKSGAAPDADSGTQALCQMMPSLCDGPASRMDPSGRILFSLTDLILKPFKKKIQFVMDIFTGRAFAGHSHHGTPHPTYTYPFAPSPSFPATNPQLPFQSIQNPLQPAQSYLPPNIASPVPAPPSPPSSSFSLTSILPSFLTAPFTKKTPLMNDKYGTSAMFMSPSMSSCQYGNCPMADPGVSFASAVVPQSPNGGAMCGVTGGVAFPLVGKSALDNSSVVILQEFPAMVQPVFYRKCRGLQPHLIQGRCVQEFLPVGFFVSPSAATTPGTLLAQEFVMVESGCKVEASYGEVLNPTASNHVLEEEIDKKGRSLSINDGRSLLKELKQQLKGKTLGVIKEGNDGVGEDGKAQEKEET